MASKAKDQFYETFSNETSPKALKAFLIRLLGNECEDDIRNHIKSTEDAENFVLMVKKSKDAALLKDICKRILKRPLRPDKSTQQQAKQLYISKKLLEGDRGLEQRWIYLDDKFQRGVFATTSFSDNDFVCEYKGSLKKVVSKQQQAAFCRTDYTVFFTHEGIDYCVDGSIDDGSMGRLINHKKPGNVKPVLYSCGTELKVYFVATRYIKPNEELFWFYNERSQAACKSYPWLRKNIQGQSKPPISEHPFYQEVFDEYSDCEQFYRNGIVVNMSEFCTVRAEMAAHLGQRKAMEDIVQCKGVLTHKGFVLAACVFDGHGGPDAARYARDHLVKDILNDTESVDPLNILGIRNGFETAHSQMEKEYKKWPTKKRAASTTNKLQGQENQERFSTAGTTATVLLISEELYAIGYVGDSKVYRFNKNETPKLNLLTIAHDLQDAEEIQRVCREGGLICVNPKYGHLGVTNKGANVTVNMTRALGDFWSWTTEKLYAVSPTPSVKQGSIIQTKYFVLSSDGFDWLSAKYLEDVLCDPESNIKEKCTKLKLLYDDTMDVNPIKDNYSFIIVEITHNEPDKELAAKIFEQRLQELRQKAKQFEQKRHNYVRKTPQRKVTPNKRFAGLTGSKVRKSFVRKLFSSPPQTKSSPAPNNQHSKESTPTKSSPICSIQQSKGTPPVMSSPTLSIQESNRSPPAKSHPNSSIQQSKESQPAKGPRTSIQQSEGLLRPDKNSQAPSKSNAGEEKQDKATKITEKKTSKIQKQLQSGSTKSTDSFGRNHGAFGRFVAKPEGDRKPKAPYVYKGYKRLPTQWSPPRTRNHSIQKPVGKGRKALTKRSKIPVVKFPFNKSESTKRKRETSSSESED